MIEKTKWTSIAKTWSLKPYKCLGFHIDKGYFISDFDMHWNI